MNTVYLANKKKNKSKRIKIDFKDPLFTHIGKGAPLHRWKYPRVLCGVEGVEDI